MIDETRGQYRMTILNQGFIIELAEGGPWLKNDLTWTPIWDERGVWHEITDAELAVARSLSPSKSQDAMPGSQQRFVSQRQSAYLNLVTTEHDIERAKREYQDGNWKECIRNIREGIKQLQSAEAKLANDRGEP
jgi:hypothetical protein